MICSDARILRGADRWHQDPKAAVKDLFDKARIRTERLKAKMEEAMRKDANEKELMDPIETFRAEMCLHRENLIEHEKCLIWMLEVCKHETSGEGSCRALQAYLQNVCLQKDHDTACHYSEELSKAHQAYQGEIEVPAAEVPAPAPPVPLLST